MRPAPVAGRDTALAEPDSGLTIIRSPIVVKTAIVMQRRNLYKHQGWLLPWVLIYVKAVQFHPSNPQATLKQKSSLA
jgi:hypothetical protein